MKRTVSLVLLISIVVLMLAGCGVSEEFKAKLDAFEEAADKLVECKEKLDENPDDLALIAEFAELSAKNTLNLAELDAMSEEEMTTAEKAYFTKVKTSVTAKVGKLVLEEVDKAN